MFSAIEPFLKRINNIHLQEKSLYSDHLQTAGRVDCIAEFDTDYLSLTLRLQANLNLQNGLQIISVKVLRMQSCTKNVQHTYRHCYYSNASS